MKWLYSRSSTKKGQMRHFSERLLPRHLVWQDSQTMHIIKDAGFVHESFWIKTNWVVWDFWSYEKNPQNKSLKNGSTKRIHDMNLLKKALQIESAIQIFKVWICESRFGSPPAWLHKDSFHAIVLRIRQDSWGFVGFVKTGRIFGSSGHETNPQFESLRIGLANPDSRIC